LALQDQLACISQKAIEFERVLVGVMLTVDHKHHSTQKMFQTQNVFRLVVHDSMDLTQIVGNYHREQNAVHLLVFFLHLIPTRDLVQLQGLLQSLSMALKWCAKPRLKVRINASAAGPIEWPFRVDCDFTRIGWR
jgi:hypothetical protein